jgi:hypothetical protein
MCVNSGGCGLQLAGLNGSRITAYALLTVLKTQPRVLYERFQRTGRRRAFCFVSYQLLLTIEHVRAVGWGGGSQRRHDDPWPQNLDPLQGATG